MKHTKIQSFAALAFSLIVLSFCIAQANATPPFGYTLTWSDEFTNNSLNMNNWEYARNGWRNSAYDTPAAVSVTNGCLVITTYTQNGTNFTGFIDTQNKVTNSYGYYEASIEFSNAPGQWSAFWLQTPWMMNVQPDGTLGNTNNNPTNGVEIDVFEHRCVDYYNNNWVNGGDNALHWNGYGPQEQSAEWQSQSLGVGTGFHTYGFLWTTNKYTFYVDGNVTWSTSAYMISSAQQFIRLTSEIQSNSWAGTVPPGGYPSQANSQIKMLVDYVRYYVAPTGPAIYRDLPGHVPAITGTTYQYSVGVTGTAPLSYQWYQGNARIPQQTNSTYSVMTGSIGSAATYHVVITNNWGAVTSAVSALTVIPPASDYYSSLMSGYGAVGYWPLQETNAPAAATIETNYGSLGPTGNAYYAAMNNMGTAQFNQSGALAGNSDPSAAFANPSGVNFAFVPHRSSALTLRPPLTMECWLNSTSGAFSDVIGQGGQGEGSSGNWGGVRLSYGGNNTGGANLQFFAYNGSGSAYNEIGTAAASLPLNQWNHCVVTYDGSTVNLYVNGVVSGSGSLPEALNDSVPLTIGDGRWTGDGTTRPYTGLIDEVAIYTNLLTAAQVENHWLAGTTTGSNYFQTVLNDSPLLYYRMDCPAYANQPEGTYPTAVNFGSAGVDGVYVPGTVPGGVAGPAMPALGMNTVAAPINGVDGFIDAGYSSAFNPTDTAPMTAMIWFKSNPADERMQALMSHGGSKSWSLSLNGANGTVVWNSGAGSVASANVLNDGDWHFVAGVYDGTKNYLYIDGALSNSAAASGSSAGNSTNDVYLGGDPDYVIVGNNQRYFAGTITEAAFFTNALSATQVKTIYQAATLPPPPETVAWTNSSNGTQLNWNYGTLQSATNVTGPYNDITNVPPYSMPMTNSQEFYRLREN